MSWVLVIFVHAGMLSNADSMALTNVPGFKTEAACQMAALQAVEFGKRTTKEVRTVCLRQE